ncbi:MAG: hypothetical protein ACR2HR_07270 [Euzebya sp.]
MDNYQCLECDETGTAAGIRRHRKSAHDHPSRAEFIDLFFDDTVEGTAHEVRQWLETHHPDGNWPYAAWDQRAVSRDLSQHKNYPRRWDIACHGHGPGALWARVKLQTGEPSTDPSMDKVAGMVRKVQSDLDAILDLLERDTA